MAPERQEEGNRISVPGDVNVLLDHDFAEMRSPLAVRRKGKKKANGTRPSCRELWRPKGKKNATW